MVSVTIWWRRSRSWNLALGAASMGPLSDPRRGGSREAASHIITLPPQVDIYATGEIS